MSCHNCCHNYKSGYNFNSQKGNLPVTTPIRVYKEKEKGFYVVVTVDSSINTVTYPLFSLCDSGCDRGGGD